MSTTNPDPETRIPRAPRVPASEARQRIADAAVRLLATTRFRDLTVDAVMAEAGLARTVFYRHFDSLPALAVALLADLVADVERLAEPLVDADLPELREGVLQGQLDVLVDRYARYGPLLLAFDDAAALDAEIEALRSAQLERALAMTTTLFATGVERGILAPLGSPGVPLALVVMNHAYLLAEFGQGDGDAERARATLWTIWSRVTGLGSDRVSSGGGADG
jgi:AcrR family transcriptional regulator